MNIQDSLYLNELESGLFLFNIMTTELMHLNIHSFSIRYLHVALVEYSHILSAFEVSTIFLNLRGYDKKSRIYLQCKMYVHICSE